MAQNDKRTNNELLNDVYDIANNAIRVAGDFGITDASNGLTLNGDTVELGGDLTKSTNISLKGNNFSITSESGEAGSILFKSKDSDTAYGVIGIGQDEVYSQVTFGTVYTQLYVSHANAGIYNTSSASENSITLNGATLVVRDDQGSKGLIYFDDYSTNFTDRSLVDKAYADGLISSFLTTKSYGFTSQGIGTGDYYKAGFYELSATDTTLSNSSLTQTFGSANNPHSSHAFVVGAGGATVDAGVVGLRVNGTRIEDDGTRTAGYSYTLSSDITTIILNEYIEAPKFIGEVEFELFTVSGTPITYTIDFNYGLTKYEDFGNADFTLRGFEFVGLAAASDSNFDIEVIHHSSTGWTYSAAAFDSPTPVYKYSDDTQTESDLVNGEYFAWKRSPLALDVDGSASCGLIIKIHTGANNSVQTMDVNIGVNLK